jgi:hypothetical protein
LVLSCICVSRCGPGARTKLTSNYEVVGCVNTGKTFYEWKNASCRNKNGPEVALIENDIKSHGHTLAESLEIRDWLLVEAFGDPEDELLLAKAVAFPDLESSFSILHSGPQIRKFYTRFWDYMIAVQIYAYG